MELNEIKKSLYKEKPIAVKSGFKGDYSHYVTQLKNKKVIEFHVPLSESEFENQVPAQLLIRWIKEILEKPF